MEKIKLKPCPKCRGEIKLYSDMDPNDPYFAFARCAKCRKEYPLPNVKLKTWKSNPIRILAKMIHDAEEAWNNRAGQEGEAEWRRKKQCKG